MALVIALVVIAGLWAVFMTLHKQLRNDVSRLSQWAQKAFGGDRVKLPALRLPATVALGETLSRLARKCPSAPVVARQLQRNRRVRNPSRPLLKRRPGGIRQ